MTLNERELEMLCDLTGVTRKARHRLRELNACSWSYGAAAQVLEIKPQALRDLVKNVRRRCRELLEEAESALPPVEAELVDPDLLPDTGRPYAAWLLKAVKGKGRVTPPDALAPDPEVSDRDTIHAKVLTVDDVLSIVKKMERERITA